MPEPNNSKKGQTNTTDPKYTNGSNSAIPENYNSQTDGGRIVSQLDAFKSKDAVLKRTGKIESAQYLKRTMHTTKNNRDGTTSKREW